MLKLLLLVTLCLIVSSNLRFKDREQLEKHHNHPTTSDTQQQLMNAIIQIHLIPHSHDDVGWLKTVDEYYYGQESEIQWAGVQYIIDSYVSQLLLDPTKKFIQVETAFFKKWWDQQKPDMQDKVKGLVKSGQLEFISGGWCMNDEATTYYEDIIDQMTLGHKFLLQTFGVKPTIGWQIDPFGHQATQASLSQMMGFNGWFFARIDMQDKEKRLKEKGMEMIMRPFSQGGQDNSIFTHVNYYHYSAPPTFNYNGRDDSQEPIVEDPNVKGNNIKSRADDFVYYFRNQTLHYRGNILMHTMGDDFQWDSAHIFYKNIDKLISYINSHPEYNMQFQYSTPSLYLQALNKQGYTYPTKEDDFYPYADTENGYWTGYFTSRVAIKGFVKWAGRYTQVVRKFLSAFLADHSNQYINKNKVAVLAAMNELDEAMGILQHHDAVAGTEKQAVTEDYIFILDKAVQGVNKILDSVLSEVSFKNIKETDFQYQTCNWNTTAVACDISYKTLKAGQILKVTILDGKAQSADQIDKIRVKVPRVNLIIVNQENQSVNGEIVCSDLADQDNCDLYFFYTIKDPKTVQYFKLMTTTEAQATAKVLKPEKEQTFTQDEDQVEVQIGTAPSFKIHYGYYESYQGSGQKSGAYIFRPTGATAQTKRWGKPLKRVEYNGNIVKTVSIQGSTTTTVVRQFNIDWMKSTYEIETFIGSIDVSDGIGKEVVMLLETNVNNQDTFYTDSNGLELQKRKINYRPTWNLQVMEPASGNYYPINGLLLLEEASTNNAAVLLNDRSQGGTSLRNGQIEIMIHRRTLKDDSRGVGEPLNEVNIDGTGLTQRILNQLSFFNKKTSPNHHRKLQLYNDEQPLNFYSIAQNQNLLFFQIQKDQTTPSAVNQLLAQGASTEILKKVYLQPWIDNKFLFRIQNLQEVGDLPLETPQGATITETTLTGNQKWTDWQASRLRWKIDGQEQIPAQNSSLQDSQVVKPLQIRTFVIEFATISTEQVTE